MADKPKLRLYHLALTTEGSRKFTELERALENVEDWFRLLSSATWLIWTTQSAAELYQTVKPVLGEEECLIFDITTGPYFGYTTKDVWDWIAKKRGW